MLERKHRKLTIKKIARRGIGDCASKNAIKQDTYFLTKVVEKTSYMFDKALMYICIARLKYMLDVRSAVVILAFNI